MTVGNKLKDQIILVRQVQWQYQLDRYTTESLIHIQKSLDKGRNELVQALAHPGFKAPHEQALLEELNDLTLGIQQKLTNDINQASAIAGEASVKKYGDIISFDGRVSGFNMIALSPEQLSGMVNAPVGGRLLGDWVGRSFSTALQTQMESEILTGYLKGEGIQKLTRRFRDAFGIVKKDAETLTRTWIAEVNNDAAHKVYKANQDIITGEEWCATLEVNTKSGRGTCLQCAGLDGRVYPVNDDHIRPPLHNNCRCFLIPRTKSYRDLGLDIDELKEVARPYTIKHGGKIGGGGNYDGTFEDWIFTQPKKYQLEVLGPNRLRLINEGKIKFQDLVDENGNVVLLKRGKDGYVGLMGGGKTVKSFKLSDNIEWGTLSRIQRNAVTRSFNKVQNQTDLNLELSGVRPYTQLELDQGKSACVADIGGGVLKINPQLFNDEFIKGLNYKTESLIKANKRLDRLSGKLDSLDITNEERSAIVKKIKRQKEKIKDYKNVRWGVGENMDDVITHELGHQIEFALDTNSSFGHDFLRPSLLREKGIKYESTLQSQMDVLAYEKGGLVSEYATKNGQEYFAESFLSYMKGETGIVDSRLISVFDKITRKP